MVGEIRDAETAQIAIQSALTGHLVFSTVHANNAFDVIGRFVNMGIEPYNFVASLNCIMAQRLVRRLCEACKVPVSVSPEHCEQLGFDPYLFADRPVYDGKGCVDCHGLGFRGRHAITEFLPVTDRIKDMILERRAPTEIRKTATAEGMSTLRQAGIEKILAGDTTMKEVNRMTFVG
jgi:type IV pilus assembly protein PilB